MHNARGESCASPLTFQVMSVVHALVVDTLEAQASHEELLTHQGKDAEAEQGEDHHVHQLLHGAQQGPHNDLEACGGGQVWGARPETVQGPRGSRLTAGTREV